MRSLVSLVLVVATLVTTGCRGDEVRPVWGGPPHPLPAGGTLQVDGFASYLAAVDEPWEQSPVSVATAFALPFVADTADVHTEFVTSDPDGNSIVSVTLGNLADDSIRDVRFVLTFDPREDGSFRPVGAVWRQRCRAGRGHQGWSSELCV